MKSSNTKLNKNNKIINILSVITQIIGSLFVLSGIVFSILFFIKYFIIREKEFIDYKLFFMITSYLLIIIFGLFLISFIEINSKKPEKSKI